MTQLLPFSRKHLEILQEQKFTATTGLLPNQLDLLESDPWTFTLICESEVIMCGGIVRMWAGRGEAWAILSEQRHKHAVAIARAAKKLLSFAQNTLVRIEAKVDWQHDEGRRFIEYLGFTLEGFQKHYFPNGSHARAYVRFRNG